MVHGLEIRGHVGHSDGTRHNRISNCSDRLIGRRCNAAGDCRLATRGDPMAQLSVQRDLQSVLGEQTVRARMAGRAHWQSTQDTRSAWRVMQVVEVVDESVDVRSFYLQDPLLSEQLPLYRAGQFLIVRPALGGAEYSARCYSLSDAAGQNWYRISVKRQVNLCQQRLSLSNWLHDTIHVGDCLLASGPHGEFVIDPSLPESTPIVLLAAGVGITPILSMLKSLLQANPARKIHLVYQVQDTQRWPFGELIHGWGQPCPGLQATTYFSRLSAEQLPEVDSGEVRVGKADAGSVSSNSNNPLTLTFISVAPMPGCSASKPA